MTGENFKCLNRHNTEIVKLKNELQNAKITFTDYSKNAENNKWNWNELYILENKVKQLEYQLHCAEYEDNRKRNWK
jgi:hypothetical protein